MGNSLINTHMLGRYRKAHIQTMKYPLMISINGVVHGRRRCNLFRFIHSIGHHRVEWKICSTLLIPSPLVGVKPYIYTYTDTKLHELTSAWSIEARKWWRKVVRTRGASNLTAHYSSIGQRSCAHIVDPVRSIFPPRVISKAGKTNDPIEVRQCEVKITKN